MSSFRFESSCTRDGGMWWIILHRKGRPYLVVGMRGILLTWVILRRERRHDHIWISIFCDVSSGGWRRVLIWHMGGVYSYMGPSTPPHVLSGTKTEHTLLLSRLCRGVHDTTLCDKVCLLLAIDRWFSPGTPVSSTNKTDRHDIAEILFKVALNTKTLTL
jgi:hypothetical protein